MLKYLNEPAFGDPAALSRDRSKPMMLSDLDWVLAVLRRQMFVIGGAAVLGLVLGVVYLLTAVPKFTASTDLIIDGKKNATRVEAISSLADLTFDHSAVDSQVEVIKSESILLSVIRKLNLAEDPEFLTSAQSPLQPLMAATKSLLPISEWLGAPKLSDEQLRYEAERTAVAILMNTVDIRRVARTFVLTVTVVSTSPKRASEIAHAIANAYLDDQLEARYESSRRASDWMLSRIAELRKKSLETDLAVQKFKADHQIATTGTGQLVNEQQLGETNLRLISARTDAARARSKYERLQHIIQTRQTDAAVSESLVNPVIVELRNKMLGRSKVYADISARLGPNHIQSLNLRAEITEYERQIFDELGRIAESYKSEVDIATANEQQVAQDLKVQVEQSGVTNQTLVALRELEREAESFRSLYQTFLQRYQETIQSLSFPISDARVISAATPPLKPSSPRTALSLAIGLFGGLVFGTLLGALRELSDRGFRTGPQVRSELDLELIGMMPKYDRPRGSRVTPKEHEKALHRYVLDHPLTNGAETIRSAKVAIDIAVQDKTQKIVGVISTLPSEGKSTIAKNLASQIAQSGHRTVLIDGDMRNPSLSKVLAPGATAGLLEVLVEQRPLDGVTIEEKGTGLVFLPVAGNRRVTHTADLLSSDRMRDLIQRTCASFEYVIVDLPPLGPIVDARAAAHLFDSFVFVVEWGQTRRDLVRSVCEQEHTIHNKTVGVVLNKVDFKAIKLYQDRGAAEIYQDSYRKYYSNSPA